MNSQLLCMLDSKEHLLCNDCGSNHILSIVLVYSFIIKQPCSVILFFVFFRLVQVIFGVDGLNDVL